MTLPSRSKGVGQVLVAGFGAGAPPAPLVRLAQTGELGGYVLFRRNVGAPADFAALIRSLVDACPADLPPFIAIDQEGGRVARLGPPVVRLPPMRVLGDRDDPALTKEAAQLLGRQLRHYGVNLDFAPVLDVDTNPDNPVIGDRSFGRTPERVITHARAFARGLHHAGVVACGKHFPGHGDTAEDSHLHLPRLAHDLARLSQIELSPFAALAAELPCLMTAHVIFDALDPGVPATLSRAVVTGLLRERLGYRGVVFSDDLEMKAIADHHGLGEAACAAIEAGCDSVLVCSQLDAVLEVHEALARRAERDVGFAERVREAADRSLAVRLRHRPSPLPPAQIEAKLRAEGPEHIEALFFDASGAAPG